jgi:hypothetical protein
VSFFYMVLFVDKPDNALEALQFGIQQELLTKLITASLLHKDVAEAEGNLTLSQGLFWTSIGTIWVPEDELLRRDILLDSYTAVFAGHMGRDKTEEQVRRQFYWRGISEDIGNFIRTCEVCQSHKYKQHDKHGLCTPLVLATRPF